MSVTLSFTIEDPTTEMLTYNVIQVYRADTLGGAYAVQGTTALVAGTYYYTYTDATGDLNKWYKYSLYNTGTLAESSLSAPFRPDGVTLKRMRQACLEEFGIGMVLTTAAAGTDADTLITDDYRVKSTKYPTTRGAGSYVMPTTGTYAGQPRKVTSVTPSTGAFEINPAWGGAPGNGTEFEWTWLCDFNQLNMCARAALRRYWYLDRVPIAGVVNAEEYNLSGLPFIKSRKHIVNVNVLFNGATVEEEWGVSGRWWGTRTDREVIILQIEPSIAATDTLYLEVIRQMPPLYDDASAAPNVCDEAYAAALMYDEILAYLSRPGNAPQQDRREALQARLAFAPELRTRSRARLISPRRATPQLPTQAVVPAPWKAR